MKKNKTIHIIYFIVPLAIVISLGGCTIRDAVTKKETFADITSMIETDKKEIINIYKKCLDVKESPYSCACYAGARRRLIYDNKINLDNIHFEAIKRCEKADFTFRVFDNKDVK